MRWKTLKSEFLYKSEFGNLRKDRCQLPNGLVIENYHVNEYSDWVNAVVITKDKKLVLVKQYRYAANGIFLEIPSGKIEEWETNQEGILREVKEETGYISKIKPILLGEYFVNPATQNNKVITYLILDAYKAYEQDLDDTENIEVNLIGFDSFESLFKNKKILTQMFSISAYYMAKDYMRTNRLIKY
ncbi:ADP-ribose pyrophosphatase [Lysinibacillus sp. RC46]|uniref:NUDIX hydrolase n=1 Tax=unclassified Lysinibacillus TaxID=2636778 RepID=UPI003513E956